MNRIEKDLICIVCPNGCRMHAVADAVAPDKGVTNEGAVDTASDKATSDELEHIEVTGNKCARGASFARTELTAPMRSVTTTVHTELAGMPFLPVRTDGEIPKSAIPVALEQLSKLTIKEKVCCGDIILSDLAGCGVGVIATADTGQEED